jgi:hypothetical protein
MGNDVDFAVKRTGRHFLQYFRDVLGAYLIETPGLLGGRRPKLVRRSAIQTSRPDSHRKLAKFGFTAWCANVEPAAL